MGGEAMRVGREAACEGGALHASCSNKGVRATAHDQGGACTTRRPGLLAPCWPGRRAGPRRRRCRLAFRCAQMAPHLEPHILQDADRVAAALPHFMVATRALLVAAAGAAGGTAAVTRERDGADARLGAQQPTDS